MLHIPTPPLFVANACVHGWRAHLHDFRLATNAFFVVANVSNAKAISNDSKLLNRVEQVAYLVFSFHYGWRQKSDSYRWTTLVLLFVHEPTFLLHVMNNWPFRLPYVIYVAVAIPIIKVIRISQCSCSSSTNWHPLQFGRTHPGHFIKDPLYCTLDMHFV